jgi:hypothetical protein
LLRRLTLACHELGSECALCLVLVVRLTAQTQVADGGIAPAREREDVVKLQTAPLGTTVAALAQERALAVVSLPHGPAYIGGDVARVLASPLS